MLPICQPYESAPPAGRGRKQQRAEKDDGEEKRCGGETHRRQVGRVVHEHGLEPLDHENSPAGEKREPAGQPRILMFVRQRRAIPMETYEKGCPWSLRVSCMEDEQTSLETNSSHSPGGEGVAG